jgi:hypothetical protein
VPPTAFAFASPLVTTPTDVRARGVAAITVPDQRWARCDLKVISLIASNDAGTVISIRTHLLSYKMVRL